MCLSWDSMGGEGVWRVGGADFQLWIFVLFLPVFSGEKLLSWGLWAGAGVGGVRGVTKCGDTRYPPLPSQQRD